MKTDGLILVGYSSGTDSRESFRGQPCNLPGNELSKGIPSLRAVVSRDWLADLFGSRRTTMSLEWNGGKRARNRAGHTFRQWI